MPPWHSPYFPPPPPPPPPAPETPSEGEPELILEETDEEVPVEPPMLPMGPPPYPMMPPFPMQGIVATPPFSFCILSFLARPLVK